MAADIVPELYKKIQSEFEKNINGSRKIKNFRSKGNKASAKDVSLYAAEVGKCAADTLSACLTEEKLPGGKLYWNIAQRTIIPLLEETYDMIMAAAESVQREEDEKKGIQLNPIWPEFPMERIKDLINKLIEYQEEADE